MPRPVVALLTDFGLRDHYAGTVKGVVLTICRDATLVDISHDVPPQDVTAGALELVATYRYFPPGTIFLVVVDPGVGSARRALAIEAGGYRFVGPDNGVFSLVLDDVRPDRIVELTDVRYALPTISRTFEGRDRFGPAAAWLAHGLPIESLGTPVESYTRLEVPRPRTRGDEVEGDVLHVDRFGNLITNIDVTALERVGTERATVLVGGQELRIVSTYADVGPGELCALFGSAGRLEVAVRGGTAAATLGLGRGARVRVAGSA